MGSPAIFNGSRTKLLTSKGLLLQSGATIDYDGDINYIANTGFEINATGYNAYANAAGAAPVTGSGGSPTVTIARSTSTPLMQTASGLFTKGASNLQGQGFSYDFSIDSGVAAQGLPCTIQSYYKIASGTYVSGDMTVWIYDVTNGTTIQPTGSSILNTLIPGNLQCEFQPNTNSTSYRLIFHVSTVSALAYNLQFDNIRVSPNTYNPGAVVTNWVDYPTTPTLVGFGTPTALSFQSRRVGDSIQFRGKFTSGTSTAVTAQIPLPNGLSIDSVKNPAIRIVGTAASDEVSVRYFTVLAEPSNGYVSIGVHQSGEAGLTKQACNTYIGSGVTMAFFAEVPVAGWSTSQVLSSDTATNIVDFYGSGAGGAITANVTNIPVTSVKDSVAGWTGSTYVVQTPGDYQVMGGAAGPTASVFSAYVNTVATQVVGAITAASTNGAFSGLLTNLKTGDVVSIRGDASQTLTAARISFIRISGPAQIAASESVNARYYGSATTISGSLATVVWTTKDFDSHNAMSSGVYTVSSPGKYQVNTGLLVTGTIALNNNLIVEIQRSGTVVSRFTEFFPATLTDGKAAFSDIISCIAGDTIRVQVSTTATAPSIVSSNFDNYVSVARVGN